MASIDDLYALQETDLALDARRAALADIESSLGGPEGLAEARGLVEQRREALRKAEAAFKEREWEADEVRQKVQPLERRLYGGSVRNPKELEDLQRDIESLRRRQSALEDRALEAMEALERAQEALRQAERDLDQRTAAWQAEQEALRARQASLEQQIPVLEARRGEQARAIEAGLLQLYERLRQARQGHAVAKLEGGACQGCRISLPMHLVHRARSGGEVVQCNNCERILYVS